MKKVTKIIDVCILLIGITSLSGYSQATEKQKKTKVVRAAKRNPKQTRDIASETYRHPKEGARVAKDANNNPGATKKNYKAAKKHPTKYKEVKSEAKNNRKKAKKKYSNNKGKLKNKSASENYKNHKNHENR